MSPTFSSDVERLPLLEFAEKAYLDYSMYVILDRALPHLGDGLKPVQRRIIYAMSELGLSATSKPKKSARTVGDVLGKYHPHGDSACYEAMVLLAQSFSTRYPFIDGQGNWGSPDDPKSFAAMRYTEAKLTRYAKLLLAELGQGTVSWSPNFDGTLEEPTILPAQVPNLLVNGGSGIAVGMATDVPPHNLTEVLDATIHLLQHPNARLETLLRYVPAPDYPSGADIITPAEELAEIYATGHGSVRCRAVWVKEEGNIVVTALPHQVSGAKMMEQIAGQMRAKKLPMVSDLRDESDHEDPQRLVIVPRSNRVDLERLMSHLFASTDLERSYRVNINVIALDGRPKVLGLKEVLSEWISFRKETVMRRLSHRLKNVLDRIHVLEGMLVCYLNLDEVIRIIRTEDEPKPVLMQRFDLSDRQAESILETKLRHLAKLEEMRIRGEMEKLLEERAHLEAILQSEDRLVDLIKTELQAIRSAHGDPRRSKLVQREAAVALREADLLPTEPLTVVLSDKGWVRAGKGHELDGQGLNYKPGDEFLAQASGRSNQQAIFLDSTGRSYSLPSHTLPSARGYGEPLTGRLQPQQGAGFVSVLLGDEGQKILLATDIGYGFIGTLGDLLAKNRAGKAVLTVTGDAEPLPPILVDELENHEVAVITSAGYLLVFPLIELPQMARGKGNKLINIPSKLLKDRSEIVAFLAVLPEGSSLKIHAGKRHMTLASKDLEPFRGRRALRGSKLPRGLQRVEAIEVEE